MPFDSNSKIEELDTWIVDALIQRLEETPSTITYSDLAKKIEKNTGCDPLNPHFSFSRPLGRIQNVCFDLGLPCLSAMVVQAERMNPGKGFVSAYRELHPESEHMSDDEIAKTEWQKVKTFEGWQALLDYYGIKRAFTGPRDYFAEQKSKEDYKESRQITEKITQEIKRSPEARERCLEIKGCTCAVCGFNSEELYGVPGIIHVHHGKPLAERLSNNSSVQTDPVIDLIPVCPNCHALIHSKRSEDGCYTIEEAKNLINQQKK
jgi:hypothetical protein